MVQELIKTYPFNLARAIFKSEKDAFRIYLPGLEEAMETLNERERNVLILRFQKQLTLEECGKEFGITRERIRQIQEKTLRKLRHPTRSYLFIATSISELKEKDREIFYYKSQNKWLKDLCEKIADKIDIKISVPEDFPNLNLPIEDIGLSVRAYNCLKRERKDTVKDIVDIGYEGLQKIRHLGEHSIEHVVEVLKKYGVLLEGFEDK